MASSDAVERPVIRSTAIPVADMPAAAEIAVNAGIVDHVFEISLSDRLEIKAAVETFIWGLSNRRPSAVWMMAPVAEQVKLGSRGAVYGYFSRIHPPLAHAKSIAFDSIATANSAPIVNFYVTDTAALQWRASFSMARGPAGGWKIVECQLTPAPGDLV